MVTIITAVVAFLVSWLMGFWLIPFLKKIHFGQTILDIGPKWHKSKQGTPIMGGFLFICGTIVAVLVGFLVLSATEQDYFTSENYMQNVKLIAGFVMALLFAFVGFMDDYIKAVKKQNLGLNAKQKMVLQILIACAYLATIYLAGDKSTVVTIPLLGQFDLKLFYYPLMVLFIVFMVNAANLTDGVDGLCGSVTFVAAISFMVICAILKYTGIGIYATALAASCLGFLMWNFHPAKVFMGDTGSMFLGGSVVAIAFGLNLPSILILVGIIYIVEALSVVLQVISFKTTGKRIFKMSPIHHHFEMCGWKEVKIVTVFSAIALVFCLVAIVAATRL